MPIPAIPPTLAALKVPVAGLKPYDENPRRGNLDVIVESLTHHGQYRPIVVRAKTFEVLAGNHTLAAAKELGWTEIAATFVECTDDQAARIVLVDNRSADLGAYDDEVLAHLLAGLPDLDGTGFDADDLATLLALNDPQMPSDDLDAVLAEGDQDLWPWVHAQLDPETYARFQTVEGDDDAARLAKLIDLAC